ncbi:MAG: serine/threonine-protein phosphatase [Bacteroidales bacterium]|nr:serine/threonine-protein phosphatase [Bacteroidales bacterium]
MKIDLFKPQFIFGKGKRDNMEDCIFPYPGLASENDGFFIVCDGMGGHAKGEVASKLACETLGNYFSNHISEMISETTFLDAFNKLQSVFDEYTSNNASAKGMGTTVVMAVLHHNGIAVAHVGDSRFYHFRNGKIIWQTLDHSLVNQWVKQGLISKADAIKHPKSNVITRAIQGKKVAKVSPEVNFIYYVVPGDYFLLCTDGITEGISESQLCDILGSDNDNETKIGLIEQLCEANSRDNYSAYLLKVKEIH